MKSGHLNFLETSGPLQACNGTDLPFLLSVRDWVVPRAIVRSEGLYVNKKIHWHQLGSNQRRTDLWHSEVHLASSKCEWLKWRDFSTKAISVYCASHSEFGRQTSILFILNLWSQDKQLHMPRTTDYRHTRQDRWIQAELVSTHAKNAAKPNSFEIIPLQTTRKENNWMTEETIVGDSGCNFGDGTDQRVQSLMFMMMVMMIKRVNVSGAYTYHSLRHSEIHFLPECIYVLLVILILHKDFTFSTPCIIIKFLQLKPTNTQNFGKTTTIL